MRRACSVAFLAIAACSSAQHAGTTTSGSAGAGSGTGTAGSGTTSAGTTSGTSGATSAGAGPYQAFDGGPHHIRFPNAAAADAGCSIADPVLDDAEECVQCASDSDCPAPLVCETGLANDTWGLCGQCSQAEQICPTGDFCNLVDQCRPDCTTGSPCLTPLGGYCAEPVGCALGCRSDTDCPSEHPSCDPTSGLCGPCVEGPAGSAGGCPTGQICGYRYQFVPGSSSSEVPTCITDCRLNPGSCRPGTCDEDAGSCLAACKSDADCAGTLTPHCGAEHCYQCSTDGECDALGVGTPVCAMGTCSAFCYGDPAGCAAEQCASLSTGTALFEQCVCTADGDCAGQALAPSCIPMSPDAGLDADAGRYGSCGCVLGGCGAGMVCETRRDFLPPGAPATRCLPSCVTFDDGCGPFLACDVGTGYCVPCTDDSQCDADAGKPTCVLASGSNPFGGGSCGCIPSACESGQVCDLSVGRGTCHPPCVYTADGFDSCLDAHRTPALCNSETGLCQQCFEAADCVGQSWFGPGGASYPFPFCSDAGRCSACNTYRDCPAGLPGCSDGVCGACASTADCAAGFGCGPWGACLTQCAGDQCAPDGGSPVCSSGLCVQCITAADCPNEGQLCLNGLCLF
jgi:hypothetical protein